MKELLCVCDFWDRLGHSGLYDALESKVLMVYDTRTATNPKAVDSGVSYMESKAAMLHLYSHWATKRSHTHYYQVFIFHHKKFLNAALSYK